MIIYKITNTITEQSYIGCTSKTLKRRWGHHLEDALRRHVNSPLWRAIVEHGQDSFIIVPLYVASSMAEALVVERGLIAEHNTFVPNGYNARLDSVHRGRKMAVETRQRMSAAFSASRKGRIMSDSGRAKLRAVRRATIAKLTATDVSQIRAELACGATLRALGARYGVDHKTICRIKHGRTWSDIPAAEVH